MPKAQVSSPKKSKTNPKTLKASSKPLPKSTRPINGKLPTIKSLTIGCLMPLWEYRWLFGGILLVYGLVNFALAQGFSSGLNVSSYQAQLNSAIQGHANKLSNGFTLFGLMLTSLGSTNSNGGGFGYTLLLGVFVSLALIWALRNISGPLKFRIRDTYYQGMYPIVPFVMILLLILVELLPMFIGVAIYVIALNNSIAITTLERIGFLLVMLLLSGLSLYFVSSSVFGLYIVTLPNMAPKKALRTAKDLVKKRRLQIILRLLYLPAVLLFVVGAIMLPVIMLIPVAAPWLFLVLTLGVIAVANSYLYNFYRELIR